MAQPKPQFSGTGRGDKTAVRPTLGYESLPAVCNCCSALLNPDRGDERRTAEQRREKRRDPGVPAAA